jgi:hypothetical protein
MVAFFGLSGKTLIVVCIWGIIYYMSKKFAGKIPSGWCITDYHSGCPTTFDHGSCVCSCHKGITPRVEKFDNSFIPFDKSKLPDYTEVVKPSATTVKDSAPKRRGRPPGSKNKSRKNSGHVVMSAIAIKDKSNLSSFIRSMI